MCNRQHVDKKWFGSIKCQEMYMSSRVTENSKRNQNNLKNSSYASLTSWRQPWCKGRITCLWIKSVFDCLTIGIIHETMVVHMTWVWTFFNNYIYIYMPLIMLIWMMHSDYGLILWEKALHSNSSSHWLNQYPNDPCDTMVKEPLIECIISFTISSLSFIITLMAQHKTAVRQQPLKTKLPWKLFDITFR